MDFPPARSRSSNVAIGGAAIYSIQTHQKEFSQLCKQSAPGAKAHVPEQVKIYLTPSEKRYFGDGSVMGAIKVFFWNLVTLFTGCSQCGKDLSDGGRNTLHERINDGEIRARHIADAGIDDCNESTQFNWLHHLPSGEVEELISVVHELKRIQPERPELDFDEREEIILYTLKTKAGVGTYEIVATTDGIWFRQAGVVNPDAFKIMSVQDYQNMRTLDKIKRRLSEEARIAFQPYLTLQDIGYVDKTSPVVVGYIGGSTALKVLMGIQAGKITINKAQVKYLVTALNAEATIVAQFKNAKNEDEVKIIRQDIEKDNEPALNALRELGNLTYRESDIPLIFSSDIASDEIGQKMKKMGVIFIAGTDDLGAFVAEKRDPSEVQLQARYSEKIQGFYQDEPEKKVQSEICTNAHYDESTKTLYVNRGLEITGEGNRRYIRTAFGQFQMTMDMKTLVDEVNKCSLPDHEAKDFEGKFYRDKFLSFNPAVESIQNAAHQLKVRIAIVDEMVMTSQHAAVVALNPLKSLEAQPLLAARIGRVEQKSDKKKL